ncbi:OprD family outer membrane porin [Sulfurimonas sp.]|uniref:OprD family outer membrane porin n=1 Tax=Sulfurimonas sp. TaxID=2022749 RepID=UPI0026299506|nr:OprD family outer membrane porin [Sulfurimonas sp.]MDD5157825.1 OprD family outer membrane porin [Sulfurimonas sp.]
MIKLSIATALMLATAIFTYAADDLESAFKDGKFDGRLRAQYFNTNWIDNDGWAVPNKPNLDSQGMAIGGSLIYKTAPLHGLSAGVGFYITHGVNFFTDDTNGDTKGYAKNTTASDLFARGPGAATNFGAGYSVLAQSYLQYDIAKTSIKGGRFLMSNPWITPNDTKMIPIAIQGAQVISNDLANTTIQLDYADRIKERGMTYFGSMADTGDTPDAIKNYYKTHYTAYTTPVDGINYGVDETPGVTIIGIKNKSIDPLEIQAWGMHWQNIIDQGMLEANYAIKAGDTVITLGVRYMQQFDTGAGDIITPKDGSSIYASGAVTATNTTGGTSKVQLKGDNDNSVNTYMYATRAVVNYKAARFLVAYSHTDGGGDLIAPWRGFPTDGYTRSMTITDWNANTKAYKAELNYDFNSMVSGLSALISYSYYNRDPSKVGYQGSTDRYYNNGDTHQWNIDAKYKVPTIKKLELKVRYMIQDNQIILASQSPNAGATASEGYGNDTSNRELRLEANYYF